MELQVKATLMRAAVTALVLLVAGLAVVPVFAAPVTVTWTHPTSYSDGSPLVVADIASTTVEYGSCNGSSFGTKAGQVVVNGPAASAQIERPPGTHCFRAATTVIASKGGGTSTFSNVASKVVPFPSPNPPTIIDVIVAFVKRLLGWFV